MPSKSRLFSQLIASSGQIKANRLSDDISTIEQVASTEDLTAVGNTVGDQRVINNNLYIWNGSGWFRIALINETPTWDYGGQPAASYVLDADSPQDATVITLAASDPDGFPISYSYVTGGSMDSIATISQDSSVFTITPKTSVQAPDGGTGTITFRASDGINILPQVSSFTLNFISVVENSKYTTLLATATDTSDNNNITDASSNNHTITVNGDTHAGTFSPYRSGGYSTYFDGTGDYLTVGSNIHNNIGTGDFTVEAWIYLDEAIGSFRGIFGSGPSDADDQFMLAVLGSGVFYFDFGGSQDYFQTTAVIDEKVWNHIALTRSGTSFNIWLNGTSILSTSLSTSIGGASNFTVGAARVGAHVWKGYISDLRVVTGSAVYTSAFTPPTERLTAITNTELLACHLPYIADGSSNNHSITINGDPETKPFSPYDYNYYSATVHGGSVYFDGSGDVIYTPQDTAFNIGIGDFTFEAWVYPTLYTSNNWNTLFAIGNTSNFGGLLVGKTDTGSFVIRQYGTANVVATTNLPDLNAWTHIACVRSSGTSKLYYNGSEIATASDTTNYSSTTPFAHIGNSDHTTYSHYWNGYVSDARFISGTAVYSGAFTPPTGPLTTTGGTYSSTTNVNTSITASNTLLLIKGTDASIIDKSQGSNLKLIGDTIGSTTQVKFSNTKSMYFDGTGDYLTTGNNSNFNLGTGALTVELWYYLSNTQTHTIFELHDGYPNGSGTNYDNNRAKLAIVSGNMYLNDGTANLLNLAETQVINQWRHWAWSRDASGNNRFFIDGSQVGTTVSSSNNLITPVVDLGRRAETNGTHMQGYIQDFRITKGLARYTANFTPPTTPLEG
jgi:hypothetical protein